MDWGSCVENGVATLSCIPIIFKNVVNWALILAGITAVFFIIFSGIKFITSGGDPKQVEGARQTVTWAIIGLLIVLFSFGIINIIAGLTGASCIKEFGFTNCK
ncbi:MAG: pilin [Patescibacteria group bacterium]|nr:pilin [Patescibacteria group bacterium]